MTEIKKAQLHHKIVIIGGGTAGISVAARLRKAKEKDIAVIEPSEFAYYQPFWTLVGGGIVGVDKSIRKESDVMPQGVHWIKDSATIIDPDNQIITTSNEISIRYDFLIVCPGIQLDWGQVVGAEQALKTTEVSSNYSVELAPKTWDLIKTAKGGTAVFTIPSTPIKCAGAPQKIAYLAADYWRKRGILDNFHIVMVLPSPKLFGVPEFSKVLEQVVDRYNIDVRFQHEVVEIDSASKKLVMVDNTNQDHNKVSLDYDLMHFTPPQSAPDWIKKSPLSTGPFGYVDVDKYSLQHNKWPNIFALGDVGSMPTSKTGAAIRKQAPIVVSNLLSIMSNKTPSKQYNGYSSCPLTTARNKMLLAEFDYDMKPYPTIPVINTQKERYDMWLLKRYGLPFMYWHLMLKGLA